MELRPCGDAALQVEVRDLDQALALHAALAAAPPPGVTDVVLAARTVLVRFDPAATTEPALRRALRAVEPATEARRADRTVEVPVTYDGDDLAEVGERTGLGPEGVVAAHTGQVWTVAFAGFAPGFAYLAGEDDRLDVPRRGDPRPRVPAGAVGLAGTFSGIYPRPSPGGWQLLGRTDLAVWDLGRDPPALLTPGTQVRFVAVDR